MSHLESAINKILVKPNTFKLIKHMKKYFTEPAYINHGPINKHFYIIINNNSRKLGNTKNV
jgi:hypothetical protein